MAVAYTGPTNLHLRDGTTDGKARKPDPDRGGVVESTYMAARRGLSPDYDDVLRDATALVDEPSGRDIIPLGMRGERRGPVG